MKSAEYWIEKLALQAHPEGGYFREMYRAAESVPATSLPGRYGSARSFGTSIYFLLKSEAFSAFHRLQSDEGWHFYAGQPVTVHILSPAGDLQSPRMGPDFEAGERFQLHIPANHWFAAEVTEPGGYCLVGCTVAPGFDFADFELAEGEKLGRAFPDHAALIHRLTR